MACIICFDIMKKLAKKPDQFIILKNFKESLYQLPFALFLGDPYLTLASQRPSHYIILHCLHGALFKLELKQISEIFRYLFQIHYPDTGFELFRIVPNYFKQL